MIKNKILILFLFGHLTAAEKKSESKFLSDIVSEQLTRIDQALIKAGENHSGQANIQRLNALKSTIISVWNAEDLDSIFRILPEDLRLLARIAKPDFSTPVLDTRRS